MASTDVAKGSVLLTPRFDNLTSSITKAFSGASSAAATAGAECGESFTSQMVSASLISTALTTVIETITSTISDAISSAVDAYADYEQLVGGVETLFEEAADTVEEYAAAAYSAAGLSANDYMETVTSFAASLISSLDGDVEEAAEVANTAIEDMADNANKMGTDITSIQNAYQGFAKQNYTMLDNLKLGYGGTQSEMERLIEDANELLEAQGEVGDLTIDSFADIVEAIHIIQEEMGITGTTALEASETISGSVASMQAAWENWLVGIADETADVESLTDTLMETVATAMGNVVPRFAQVIATLIAKAPSLMSQLGEAFSECVPDIVERVAGVFEDTLPEALYDALVEASEYLEQGFSVLLSVAETARDELVSVVEAVEPYIEALAEGLAGLVEDEGLRASIEALGRAIEAVGEGLQVAYGLAKDSLFELLGLNDDDAEKTERVTAALGVFCDALTLVITTATSRARGAEDFINDLLGFIVNIPQGVVDSWTALTEAVEGFLSAVSERIAPYVSAVQGLVDSAGGQLESVDAWQLLTDAIVAALDGLSTAFDWLTEAVGAFFDFIENPPEGVQAFIAAVTSVSAVLWDALSQLTAEDVIAMFDSLLESIVPIVEAVGEMATAFLNWVAANPEDFIAIVERLAAIVIGGKLLSAINGIVLALKTFFSSGVFGLLGTGVSTLFSTVSAAITAESGSSGIAYKVGQLLGTLVSKVTTFFASGGGATILATVASFGSKILSGVVSFVTKFTPQIAIVSAVLTAVGALLSWLFSEADNGKTNLENIVEAVGTFFSDLGERIGEAWDFVCETLGSLWEEITTGAGEAISGWLESVAQFGADCLEGLGEIKDDIVGFFGDAAEWLWDAGSDLVSGLIDGITGAADAVWDTVTDVASSITGAICSALGISSPSKVFAEIGENIDAGLAEGIESGAAGVLDSMTTLGDGLTDSMSGAGIQTDLGAAGLESSFVGSYEYGGGITAADLYGAMSQALGEFGGFNVVMDSGELVGSIAGKMDKELGYRKAIYT